MRRRKILFASTLALLGLAGCHNDMWIQPKMKPQAQSDFFPDQASNRPLVAHSVARSQFWTDSERYTGYSNEGKIATTFPFQITRADLVRGEDRFNIYCSPCHGALGNGQGMIAQRGFALRRPPGNYHTKKLREAPVGHFYDVITNGFGSMYSYASRIEPDDRWRIAAYIRALQRSQSAAVADVDMSKLNAKERKQIETAPPGGAPNPDGSDINSPSGANGGDGTTGSVPQPPAANTPGSVGDGTAPPAPIKETPPAGTGSSTRSPNGQPAPTLPDTNKGAGTPLPSGPSGSNVTTPSTGGPNGTNNR